jgi:hypothetical protein
VFAVADGEWLRHPVGVQRRVVAAWLAGVALAGCFYTAPINRQPKVSSLMRQCDAAHPADPCTRDNLHHGDHVMVMAVFRDPDGDVNAGTVQWRISACDGPIADRSNTCDLNRLYEQTAPARPPYPEFTVPSVLTGSAVPVQTIVFDFTVFDDRGASSTAADEWVVIPDPP